MTIALHVLVACRWKRWISVALVLLSPACHALGPPVEVESPVIPAGKQARLLSLSLPTRSASPLGRSAALCSARCQELVRVEDTYWRCLANCPGAQASLDATCTRDAGVCLERVVAVTPEPEPAQPSAVLDAALAVLGVLGVIGVHVGLVGLCEEYSSDPNCGDAWSRVDPLNPR